ncbi:MAG: zinc-ribbon domain-containing protein [Thaumarchaeota archaeon]|nr:zinc-ribbon domain-containing protein [Nitrososphaerota archaeon]
MSGTAKYCHKCGSELPPGAVFCAVCGTPVYTPSSAGPSQSPTTPTNPPLSTPPPYEDRRTYREWRRERRRNEKGEKNEKYEKGEKGGAGGGITGPLIGGTILIWLGITFYLQQLGRFPNNNWWALFLVGLGIILIFQGVLLYSRSHHPFYGPFIGGAVLVLIGLSSLFGSLDNLWPLLLVIIGFAVLASAFGMRRRTPSPR